MSFKVLTILPFDRQLKRLAKKYPSLKNDFLELVNELTEQPEKGTPIGKKCYKIRFAIKSKGKGRSGAARVITSFVISEDTVYLLSIYDKSDQNSLSDKELIELLKHISE